MSVQNIGLIHKAVVEIFPSERHCHPKRHAASTASKKNAKYLQMESVDFCFYIIIVDSRSDKTSNLKKRP